MPDAGPAVTIVLGTFLVGDDSPLHDLVRRFRAGDPDAYGLARRAAIAVVKARRRSLAETGLVVAVPAHEPDVVERPLDRLVRELAAAIGWIAPPEPPLLRRHALTAAKHGGGEAAVAEASLAWAPRGRPRDVILVDDVVRSGGTIAACVSAIRAAEPSARPVLVLCMARATEPSQR